MMMPLNCLVILAMVSLTSSFTIGPNRKSLQNGILLQQQTRVTSIRIKSTTDGDQEQANPASMRVKEIQAELKERQVSYADCFDKESLVKKLLKAREQPMPPPVPPAPLADDKVEGNISSEEPAAKEPAAKEPEATTTTPPKPKKPFDKEAKMAELRSMKVRELKEACGKRRIRWAKFVEKEDFVSALITAMESAADFSVSGVMTPGEVTDLTGDQLLEELSQPSDAPLLLDIYATWCGPCQMMAPQLVEAAAELGDRVRVGKIDSDKHPAVAQKLKAAGLPTVLVLNGDDELQRMEGALMKAQILQFVEPFI